jgi:hypothetical protein
MSYLSLLSSSWLVDALSACRSSTLCLPIFVICLAVVVVSIVAVIRSLFSFFAFVVSLSLVVVCFRLLVDQSFASYVLAYVVRPNLVLIFDFAWSV